MLMPSILVLMFFPLEVSVTAPPRDDEAKSLLPRCRVRSAGLVPI